MKNIILLAVQGAGKGTVAKALQDKYNYVHISTGDILRERRKKQDEIAKIIAQTQDSGILTPSEIVYKVIEERLSEADCDNGYILDGFPRTVEQAIECDKIAKKLNKEIDIAIYMTIPDEVLIERIISRRICNKCRKIYSISFTDMKPKIDGKCDDCDGELIFRYDDSDENAIKTRIGISRENAEPLIKYYKDKSILFEIDASVSSKSVIQEIEKLIKD